MDAAPALSTHQDEATFQFDKVSTKKKLRNHLEAGENVEYSLLVAAIRDYYSLDQVEEYLLAANDDGYLFKHITLQFPDELLMDAATVVHELQRNLSQIQVTNTIANHDEPMENCKEKSCGCRGGLVDTTNGQRLWILADTSYSPCCIDEVAAEHANSDLVVHFGDACLNPVDKVRAAYVLGKPKFEAGSFGDRFKEKFTDFNAKIVVMADAPFTRYLRQFYDEFKSLYPNLVVAELYQEEGSFHEIIDYKPMKSSGLQTLNRTFEGGLSLLDDLEDYSLLHITRPHDPRLLQLTTRFSLVSIYDPFTKEVVDGPYPNLMRRYRYMHMARSAGTIGILVNTLSLSNTKTLLNAILSKIREAGKKYYMFVVGKPNVAKLANFENVELWCVLGCDHQGIIIDQLNEYFKPIITPYELILALNDEVEWTGQWVTEFNTVLDQLQNDETVQEEKDVDESDEEPVFDPVTGTFVSTSKPLRRIEHLRVTMNGEKNEPLSNSLVERFSNAVAIKGTVSTSAMHLQSRQWTGLGSDFVDDEQGAIVEEGRGGIARGYDYDREVHK